MPFHKSLLTLREFQSFDSLLYEVNGRILQNDVTMYQDDLNVWVPILYRLGLVQKALCLGMRSQSFFHPTKEEELNSFYLKMNADLILTRNLALISEVCSNNSIIIAKAQSRKKSLFSLEKKSESMVDCLDLLGIEIFLDYDVFFSENLGNLIFLLSKEYTIVKYRDFLSVGLYYKYIPLINIVLQDKMGSVFQLKFKCFGFEGAEVGVNYFEYKGYNIDNILLNDQERLFKILYLKQIELDSSPIMISKLLFDELKTGEYIHLQDVLYKNINPEKYLLDIDLHKQRMERRKFWFPPFF